MARGTALPSRGVAGYTIGPLPRFSAPPELPELPEPSELPEHELIDVRAAAQKYSSLDTSIAAAYGEASARRVVTAGIADLVQRVRGTDHLVIDRPWEEYA